MKKLEYSLSSNISTGVSCVLKGVYDSEECSKFAIPSCIDNHKVTAVESALFKCFNKLESLDIPSSVERIGSGDKFNSIFPDTLSSIHVVSGNSSYSSLCGVLYDIKKNSILYYPKAKSDKKFEPPQTMNYIAADTFVDNPYLESFSFKGETLKVSKGAFHNCSNLRTITFECTSLSICDGAFVDCPALESIKCTESKSYVTEDDVLYYINPKRTRTLMFYPPDKREYSYKAHPDTTAVSNYCFSKNCRLHTLSLPSSCSIPTLNCNIAIEFYESGKFSRNNTYEIEGRTRVKNGPTAIADRFTKEDPTLKSDNLKTRAKKLPENVKKPRKKDRPVNTQKKDYNRVFTINDPEMDYPIVIYGGHVINLEILTKKIRKLYIPGCSIIDCYVTKHTVYICRDLVSENVIDTLHDLARNEQINLLISSMIRGIDGKDSHNPKAKSKKHSGGKLPRCTFEPLKGHKAPTGVINGAKCPGARNPVKLWH